MKIGKGEKLVMIGDSITDCGRTRPVAEGLFDPLGRGYVTMVEALLGAAYPQLGIRVVNMGNGGNQVRDLKDRWQTDVIALQPDWLSVYIGINDVWRQFDMPRQPETPRRSGGVRGHVRRVAQTNPVAAQGTGRC